MRAKISSGADRFAAAPSRSNVRFASSASSPGSTSTHHDPAGTMSASCVRLAAGPAARAVRSMLLSSTTLRCETVSKVRSDSISSPISSTRTGRSQSIANRSMIPPRRANVPGVSMALVACHPLAMSQSASSAGSSRPSTSSRRVLASISRGSASGARSA